MDVINNSAKQHDTFDSAAETSTERLFYAKITEMETMHSHQCDETTALLDSLLTTYNSVYLDEMLAKLGPDLPILELSAGFEDKVSSDYDIRVPEIHPSRVSGNATNFVEEICDEIPSRNDIGIGMQENSMVVGGKLAVKLRQLKQQHQMILEARRQFHQSNPCQALLHEKQHQTQVDQKSSAKVTDQTQVEIAEIDVSTIDVLATIFGSSQVVQPLE